MKPRTQSKHRKRPPRLACPPRRIPAQDLDRAHRSFRLRKQCKSGARVSPLLREGMVLRVRCSGPFSRYPHVAETRLACSHQSAAVWLLPSPPLPAPRDIRGRPGFATLTSRGEHLRPEPGGHVPALPLGQARGGGRVWSPTRTLRWS